MKRIDELFSIVYGVNLDLSKLTKSDNGINYVGRSKKNNGVTARVLKEKDINPNPARTISVSGGGSVLEAFVQEEEYYSGRDLFYLKPYEDMDMLTLQYYCMCIKANKFKYSYGRQANVTLGSIMVPDISEIPSWVKKDRKIEVKSIPNYFLDEGYERACWYLDNVDQKKFEETYSKSVLKEKEKIDLSRWHYFNLSGDDGLFYVDHGKRLKSTNRIEGDIPLITAGMINQGVASYIQENDEMKLFENCITIDMFGNSFYHPEEFYCDDNIVTLKPKSNISKYACHFISTIINNENYRYSFGRQYRKTKYADTQKIFLPAKETDGIFYPDYDFMDKYIKSINYSSSL